MHTVVFSDVRLGGDGEDHGANRIPYSVDRLPHYRMVTLIHRVQKGSGLSILLIGGNQVDEYEG